MTQQSEPLVLVEVEGGVGIVTLNRPSRANAWTQPMAEEYCAALERLAEDGRVRAIVVTGAGRFFCVGADMEALDAAAIQSTEHQRRIYAETFPLSVNKPIIAAINGACAGIGLVHALMCDLRFADANVKFTTSFSRRGLIAEHGVSWLLPRVVGRSAALDLLMSARVVLSDEALQLGLVDRVTPEGSSLQVAIDYAKDVASFVSPTAAAAIKQQVNRDALGTFAEAADRADALMTQSFAHEDLVEGITSFMEKRDPLFAPLASGQGVHRGS